ncbi:MAG: hypothetical protein QW840_00215 [Candidatus Bathyarchaeia archaeon]
MNVEQKLLITLLKLTKKGAVKHEIINKDAKVPSKVAEKLLQKLQNDQLLYVKDNVVMASKAQRLQMAVKAINFGVDVETVSELLEWQEFEDIAATVLAQNDYSVTKNLRFKHNGKRWEIDVVGCRKPIVLCFDCKHWHYGMSPSRIEKAVVNQTSRTEALAKFLPNPHCKIECLRWEKATFVPAVLSLFVGRLKFCDNVPVVPILQLQDFLDQLPFYADSLKQFSLSGHHFQDRLFSEA